MNGVTVTLPLSQYEAMVKKIKERDISNFIHRIYPDFHGNEYYVAVNQEAIKKLYGKELYASGLVDKTQPIVEE